MASGHNRQPGAYLALHAAGLALPALSPAQRCALTAPFHPYPSTNQRAVYFLWRYPAPNRRQLGGWVLPTTVFYRVRTFLPSHAGWAAASPRHTISLHTSEDRGNRLQLTQAMSRNAWAATNNSHHDWLTPESSGLTGLPTKNRWHHTTR